MNSEPCLASFPYTSKFIEIDGSQMHYVEEGSGDPILLLHGVPTSCYLWRNIIPHLSRLGRCIAPDLIGFGKSDKPDIEYSLEDHINYLEKFIEKLNLKKIIFILHDWGSIIGFDIAMRHENWCKALVFYESYVKPLNDNDHALPYDEQNFVIQTEETKSNNIISGPHFVKRILSLSIMRPLSQNEIQCYCDPFLKVGSEKPLLTYLQELPKNNNKTNQRIAAYSEKLMDSSLPKLMLYAIPGFITTIATVMWVKDYLKNIEIIEIGEALHYAQETNPTMMGETISVWLQSIEQN